MLAGRYEQAYASAVRTVAGSPYGGPVLTTLAVLRQSSLVGASRLDGAVAHAALYKTCATIIIAVAVILYFDMRVRAKLSPQARGRAIGYLGAIIGVILGIPVLALAGFTPDDYRTRLLTVALTFAFLLFAFGTAMRIWGSEDARSMRAARQPPLTPDSAGMHQLGLSERERAAKVLARAQDLLTLGAPLIINRQLAAKGAPAEVARLQELGHRWLNLQPEVLAIAVGYPSAAVRANVAKFVELVGGCSRRMPSC